MSEVKHEMRQFGPVVVAAFPVYAQTARQTFSVKARVAKKRARHTIRLAPARQN